MIDREALGRIVRNAWVEWAHEQPHPKPSWLVPWEHLDEQDREADRRIGEAVAREAWAERDHWSATAIAERLAHDDQRARAERAEAAGAKIRGEERRRTMTIDELRAIEASVIATTPEPGKNPYNDVTLGDLSADRITVRRADFSTVCDALREAWAVALTYEIDWLRATGRNEAQRILAKRAEAVCEAARAAAPWIGEDAGWGDWPRRAQQEQAQRARYTLNAALAAYDAATKGNT